MTNAEFNGNGHSKTMPWFRMWTSVLHDRKVQQLPDMVDGVNIIKGWINLLCLTREHNGILPCNEDIAYALRLSDDQVTVLLQVLTDRGLLEEDDGKIAPHNWSGRQPVSDTDPTTVERSRRYRERQKANKNNSHGDHHKPVTRDDTDRHAFVTGVERDSESDTDSDSDKSRKDSEQNLETLESRKKQSVSALPRTTPSELTLQNPEPAKRSKKASRLSEDWQPTERNVKYARLKGLTTEEIQKEAEKFKAHFLAKSGPRALMLDWNQAWNEWILKGIEWRERIKKSGGGYKRLAQV